jgi:hypothetical protein
MMRNVLTTLALAAMLTAMPGTGLAKDKKGDVLAAWIGAWTTGPEQNITILRGTGGMLSIEGFASWGASDPDRVASGGVNVGEFYADVPAGWIEDTRLAFGVGADGTIRPDAAEQFDCVVQLEIGYTQLLATDNGMCGGHNVRFDGTYHRAGKQAN